MRGLLWLFEAQSKAAPGEECFGCPRDLPECEGCPIAEVYEQHLGDADADVLADALRALTDARRYPVAHKRGRRWTARYLDLVEAADEVIHEFEKEAAYAAALKKPAEGQG